MEGLQAESNKTCFQHRKPRVYCFIVNTDFNGEAVYVQQLPGSTRAESEKAFKCV